MKASTKRDLIFTGIVLLILFAAVGLLYAEMSARAKASGEQFAIGSVSYKYKRAERKPASVVIWNSLDQMSPVYNYDVIHTVKGASAQIFLSDGTVIDLDEETLVVVTMNDDEPTIDFQKGSMTASGGTEPIKVMNEGSALELSGTASLSNRSGDLDMTVSEGSAVFEKDGQSVQIAENEQARVSDEGVNVKQMSIIPLEPKPSAFFITQKNTENIMFKWQSTSGEKALFEVARDASFSRIVTTQLVAGTSIGISLREGEYYWRLSEGNVPLQARKFVIVSQRAPVTVSPANGEKFDYSQNNPAVHFSWTGGEQTPYYTVEISRSNDFANIVETLTAQGTSISLNTLASGTYWWRVKAEYQFANTVLTSRPSSFTLTRTTNLPAPVPAYPENNSRITTASVESKGLTFGWNKNNEIASYTLQISSDESFRDIRADETSASNSCRLAAKLNEGTWYWRVQGYDRSGVATKFSAVYTLTLTDSVPVELLYPGNEQVITDAGGTINFRWNDPNKLSKYRLAVFSDANLTAKIGETETTAAAASLKDLPAQKLYYRVQALNENSTVAAESQVRAFSLVKDLKNPVQVFPAANSSVDVLNLKAITFRWRPSEGATHYRFRLLREGRYAATQLYQVNARGNTLTFRNFSILDRDKFSWELQAIVMENGKVIAESAVQKSTFTITLGAGSPDTIKVTSPDVVYTE